MNQRTDFTVMGGDPAQQARRAAMHMHAERPEHWMRAASQSFFLSMAGHGNRPDVQLRNCVRDLVNAFRYGQPIDELSPIWETHRLPPEPDLREVWEILGAAIENQAVILCQRLEAEAAQVEARNSMTPVG